MSGLKSDAKFEYQKRLSIYRALYIDVNKNKWRIDVVGEAESVQQFITERPFNLVATRLTPEEAKKRKAELAYKKPTREKGQPDESPLSTELPIREVVFSLNKLADSSSPYVVHFEIDPRMNRQHRPESYTFRLAKGDTTANVNYTANAGTVAVNLYGRYGGDRSGPGVNGQVIVDNVPEKSYWGVVVSWGSGAPNYALSGDYVVN